MTAPTAGRISVEPSESPERATCFPRPILLTRLRHSGCILGSLRPAGPMIQPFGFGDSGDDTSGNGPDKRLNCP